MNEPAVWRPPVDFLLGVATAGHQVDGDDVNGDWWDWEQVPGHIRGGVGSGPAVDHWRRYRDDISQMAAAGVRAYRFSVEWSRVEPAPGQWSGEALDHYRDMVAACHEHHLVPLIALFHFVLPRWLAHQGGWLSPATPRLFARYAQRVAQALPGVRWWVTVNEPLVYAVMGYVWGVWPPGRHDAGAALTVTRRLLLGHRLARSAIRAESPDAQVGLAHHVVWFEPWDGRHAGDRLAAALQHRLFNWWAVDQVGRDQDFVGVNYYARRWSRWRRPAEVLAPALAKPGERTTDMGWTVYPEGLYLTLRRLGSRRLPVVVTESGIATDDDAWRVAFIRDHLAAVARARGAGVDVRGYFYWSWLDNFEWADGFAPHFGLVRAGPGADRQPRPSAAWYGDLGRPRPDQPGAR